MAAEWIGQIKRAGLAAAGELCGVARRGKGWGPCPSPSCGAKTRGAQDTRPPLTSNDGVGWHCWACGAHGDPADLLAYAIAGKRIDECGPTEKDAIREKGEAAGIVRDTSGYPGAAARIPGRPAGGSPARPGSPSRPGQAHAAAPSRSVTMTLPGRPGQHAPVTVEIEVEEQQEGVAEDRRWLGGVFSPTLAVECSERLWSEDGAAARAYLTGGAGQAPGGTAGRRLPEAAIRKWKLGAYTAPDGTRWVTVPLLDSRSGDVVNVKFCRVPDDSGERKRPKYLACPGRPLPLFGARALSNDLGSPVIIVEGELDVVALWAYGWEGSVVSGTSGAGSFADDWLDVLEPYERFVLFLDDDAKGDEGAELLMTKLGKDRCERARPPSKDAGDAWASGIPEEEIRRAMDRAKPATGMHVRRAGSYIDEIEDEISGRSASMFGISTGSERLDALFAGWTPGLNVVTGPSGTGKTTLCTWAMWSAAQAGVQTMITSFEQQPKRSDQKLLRMQLRGDFLSRTEADRRAAAAALERLPLWHVDHYGRATVADVVQTARYHRRRNGVRLVLVDHLGFLIDSSKDDERKQIDHVVRELAIAGRNDDIAFVMVAHPGKSREGTRVRIADLKGSSAIEQDAELGLVLERDRRVKVPHCVAIVDKLRKEFGKGAGASGILYFDPDACLYADAWGSLPISERVAGPGEAREDHETQPDAATRAAGG